MCCKIYKKYFVYLCWVRAIRTLHHPDFVMLAFVCCCGRRKISKIYIDHTVGSKKTNSGRESYDNFRTFYFLCMERYLFIRVIMP